MDVEHITAARPADLEYSVSVDAFSTLEWSDVLREFADANLYQTDAYARAHWRTTSRLLLRKGAQAAGALQVALRSVPALGIGVAYGRWGPMFRRCATEHVDTDVRVLLRAARREYVERRGFVLRLRPRVFLGQAVCEALHAAMIASGFVPYRYSVKYLTFLVGLKRDEPTLRAALRKDWRKNLKRAETAGLQLAVGSSDALFDCFLRVYGEMHADKRFYQYVRPEKMRDVQRHLADGDRMQVVVCSDGDQPISAAIFSAMGDTGLCLMAGTNARGRIRHASFLAKWTTLQWLRDSGVEFMDLGGRDPDATPEVDHFKSGMGGESVVLMPEYVAYRRPAAYWLMMAADLWRRRRSRSTWRGLSSRTREGPRGEDRWQGSGIGDNDRPDGGN